MDVFRWEKRKQTNYSYWIYFLLSGTISTISYKISKVSINSKLQNSTVVQIKNYFWQVSSSLIASELVWHGISIQK